MKLLFLDIDQVLYTYVADDNGEIEFGPNPVAINLMKVLLKRHELTVVLVSSWNIVLDLPEKDFIHNPEHPLAFLTPYLHPCKYTAERCNSLNDTYDELCSRSIHDDSLPMIPFPTTNGRDTSVASWFASMRINPHTVSFAIIDDSVSSYTAPFYIERVVPCTSSGFGFEEFHLANILLDDDISHVGARDLRLITLNILTNKYQHLCSTLV